MAYQPHLFIGVGRKHCLFTLRETYENRTYKKCPVYGTATLIGVEIKSFHHFNLGQDPVEVYEKAVGYAQQMGLPLNCSGAEELAENLNNIHRSTAEEMAAKIEAAAWEASNLYDEFNDRWMMENLTTSPLGQFGHGKYEGKTYEEINNIDRPYLEFMAKPSQFNDSPIDELRRLHLETWLENHASNTIEENDETIGQEGDKVELCIFVKEARYIQTDFGVTTLVKAVTPEGNRITIWYSGSSIDFEELIGSYIDCKATVKGHDEFRGEWSTTLTRVRVA